VGREPLGVGVAERRLDQQVAADRCGEITTSAPARRSFSTFSRAVAAAMIRTSGLSWRAVRIASASWASSLVATSTARVADRRPLQRGDVATLALDEVDADDADDPPDAGRRDDP